MGVLIASLVIAPFVAAAAVLDWRARRRPHRRAPDPRAKRRDIDSGIDVSGSDS